MNGKERLVRALSGQTTDRMPVQLVLDQGYMARCAGRQRWEFDYGDQAARVEMHLAATAGHPANDGLWAWAGMNRKLMEGVEIVREADGSVAVFPDGTRRPLSDSPDQWPASKTPEQRRRGLERGRIRHPDDIDPRLGEVVPADILLRQPEFAVLKGLVDSIGDRKFIWANHSPLFSATTGFLGGKEEGWMQAVTNPELVEAVMDRIQRQHLEYIKAAALAGADGLWNGFHSEGANVLGPDTWRRLVKPRTAQTIAATHQHGLRHLSWFLDDCRALVPDLIEIGTDALATEQPRTGYECDPGDLRRLAGDSGLCIFGWFWEEHLLKQDFDSAIRTLAKQFAEVGSGGPFVLSTPLLTQEYSPAFIERLLEAALKL